MSWLQTTWKPALTGKVNAKNWHLKLEGSIVYKRKHDYCNFSRLKPEDFKALPNYSYNLGAWSAKYISCYQFLLCSKLALRNPQKDQTLNINRFNKISNVYRIAKVEAATMTPNMELFIVEIEHDQLFALGLSQKKSL